MTDFDTLMNEAFQGFGDECNPNAERSYAKFLGLCIQTFDVNTQWDNGSQLDATLYDDLCGDAGQAPAVFRGLERKIIHPTTDEEVIIEQHFRVEDMIGAPYRFSMGDFEFCGLLQSLKESVGENGECSWKVALTGPDKLLDQIHLIVAGYYGDIGISNVFNVGYEIEQEKSKYIQFFWWLKDHIQAHISEWLQDPANQSIINRLPRHHVLASMRTAIVHAEVKNALNNPDGVYRQLFPIDSIAAMQEHNHAGVPIKLGNLMDLADEIQKDYLDFINPTIDGSLLYQEVLWAFNKLQAEGEGVRFNHASYSGNTMHPDVLVENGYAWNGRYYIDLSELPGEPNSFLTLDQLPRGFRIQESDLTLAKFIETVCGDDGFRCDHLWELRPSALRQVQIRQEKLEKILHREQTSSNPNEETIGRLQDLIDNCKELIQQWATETKFRIPVIKLRLCPQGYNTAESNVRHIIRVVDHLKNSGVGVNTWSAGFEKGDDMPSVLLSGAKKEIIVTAGNNLFNYRSFQTGDPFSPRFATVNPPQSFFTDTGRHYEYPSIWRMYFGQDRYNCPQVMFTEWFELPVDFVNDKPGLTTYQANYVYLDTWELKAGLRFFANNVSSGIWGLDEDTDDERPFMSEMQYNIPDYIKIAENELRSSIEFDLFWGVATQHSGDLYKLFLSVLGRTTVMDALYSGGNAWSNSQLSQLEAEDRQAKILNMLSDHFAADNLGNAGRLNTPPQVLEMIIADLKHIQEWIKGNSTGQL